MTQLATDPPDASGEPRWPPALHPHSVRAALLAPSRSRWRRSRSRSSCSQQASALPRTSAPALRRSHPRRARGSRTLRGRAKPRRQRQEQARTATAPSATGKHARHARGPAPDLERRLGAGRGLSAELRGRHATRPPTGDGSFTCADGSEPGCAERLRPDRLSERRRRRSLCEPRSRTAAKARRRQHQHEGEGLGRLASPRARRQPERETTPSSRATHRRRLADAATRLDAPSDEPADRAHTRARHRRSERALASAS